MAMRWEKRTRRSDGSTFWVAHGQHTNWLVEQHGAGQTFYLEAFHLPAIPGRGRLYLGQHPTLTSAKRAAEAGESTLWWKAQAANRTRTRRR